MRRPARLWAGVALALSLLAATGCGGPAAAPTPAAAAKPTPAEKVTGAPTGAPTQTGAPAATAAPAAKPAPAPATVRIGLDSFGGAVPVYVAQQQGFFDKRALRALKVEISTISVR